MHHVNILNIYRTTFNHYWTLL